MTYESKFLRQFHLVEATDKNDKNNFVSFVSDPPGEIIKNKAPLISSTSTEEASPTQDSDPSSPKKQITSINLAASRMMLLLYKWLRHCQPGDEWLIPEKWEGEAQRWQQIADARIRRRHPKLRIWRNVEGYFVCKLWVFD